ncbi:uncharacterized protein LOC123540278 [Mercenaria mercenaria]|uniref:uncharacterized protein LOC123540278 n=1 Tax=Mercenaria mercenaria TaxID=6596 RepID=UPI00234F9AAC|nr:uncharacterized protein LOC123540278 [Mercenaria mercenaria]
MEAFGRIWIIFMSTTYLGILSGHVSAEPCGIRATVARKRYAMYVWTTGFDRHVPGCDVAKFLEWNSKGSCFTHVWDTKAKRDWLWATCNLPGREIDAIFVSDVHHNLKEAYNTGDCATSAIARVKALLTEGHTKVPNLKIYGLYAVSDIDVSEKNLVKYIVHYNDVCATSKNERFDGVATNNEAYAGIKCGNINERLKYLDNLEKIVTEARKQVKGTLLTHYSVSWHWGRCHGKMSNMTWKGKTTDVSRHMIDIFDSIDVQVGYIIYPAISDRMKTAGYDYAMALNKPIYTTVYTNKGSPCQITFFPDDTCRTKGHNETAMFTIFDGFSANGISYAQPCIHYFRGVYSTGVHLGWPIHDATGSSPIVGK